MMESPIYLTFELVRQLHREADLTGFPATRLLADGTVFEVNAGHDPAALFRARIGGYSWEDRTAHRRFARRVNPESLDSGQRWVDARVEKLGLLLCERREWMLYELAWILRSEDYRTSHWELVVRAWAQSLGARVSRSLRDDLVRQLVARMKAFPTEEELSEMSQLPSPAPVRRLCA